MMALEPGGIGVRRRPSASLLARDYCLLEITAGTRTELDMLHVVVHVSAGASSTEYTERTLAQLSKGITSELLPDRTS